jgi:hypothetical protein
MESNPDQGYRVDARWRIDETACLNTRLLTVLRRQAPCQSATTTATLAPTSCRKRQMPFRQRHGAFRRLKQRLALKALGKKGKKPNDYWSEWQDLNLRPLRPEPGYRAA